MFAIQFSFHHRRCQRLLVETRLKLIRFRSGYRFTSKQQEVSPYLSILLRKTNCWLGKSLLGYFAATAKKIRGKNGGNFGLLGESKAVFFFVILSWLSFAFLLIYYSNRLCLVWENWKGHSIPYSRAKCVREMDLSRQISWWQRSILKELLL